MLGLVRAASIWRSMPRETWLRSASVARLHRLRARVVRTVSASASRVCDDTLATGVSRRCATAEIVDRRVEGTKSAGTMADGERLGQPNSAQPNPESQIPNSRADAAADRGAAPGAAPGAVRGARAIDRQRPPAARIRRRRRRAGDQ